jgi:DNA-directed RNA polymerase subunit N (RpoN/RPB10)
VSLVNLHISSHLKLSDTLVSDKKGYIKMTAGIGHNNPFVSVESLTTEERKKLRDAIMELNNSMTRVAAERDLQKQTIDEIFDQLGVEKKMVRRMSKVYFKANFREELEENDNFEKFYNNVIENVTP